MRQGLLRSAATLGFVLLWIPLVAGQTSAEERQKPGTLEFQESHKRILHLAPTFSIVPPDAEFKPLSAGDKFVLGATHAFDRIIIVKSLASAAISQAADAQAASPSSSIQVVYVLSGLDRSDVPSYQNLVMGKSPSL